MMKSSELDLLEQPSDQELADILKELGMTEESSRRDVATLIEWMSKQSHLPNITDEKRILGVLMACKNSMEKTKGVLNSYYTCRTTVPEFFGNRDPMDPAIKAALELASFIPLPRLTSDQHRVCIVRGFKAYNPNHATFNFALLAKSVYMTMDAFLCGDNNRGLILIYDLDGVTLSEVASITIVQLQNYINVARQAYANRIKHLYILNVPSSAVKLINLGKTLITPKLANRISICSNQYEVLYETVPKDVLPPEYGGTYKLSIKELHDWYYRGLLEKRDWFLSEEHVKAKLIARMPTKDQEPMFGIDGSFRKMAVD